MKRVFSIEQFYTIRPDERIIDIRLDEVIFTEEKWRQEEGQRLHRLYDVIMTNEKLLLEVLLYSVIREHDMRTSGFFREYYKNGDISLVDILWMYKSLLHPADQEWLTDLRRRIRAREDHDDPLVEIEPLEEVFRDGVKPQGFTIKEGGKSVP
jgi:hypothetical protein